MGVIAPPPSPFPFPPYNESATTHLLLAVWPMLELHTEATQDL